MQEHKNGKPLSRRQRRSKKLRERDARRRRRTSQTTSQTGFDDGAYYDSDKDYHGWCGDGFHQDFRDRAHPGRTCTIEHHGDHILFCVIIQQPIQPEKFCRWLEEEYKEVADRFAEEIEQADIWLPET